MDWHRVRLIHIEDGKHQHWLRETIEIRRR